MVPWFGVYQCFHCCDARTSDVSTPSVATAHPNLSGHQTFDEQYVLIYIIYGDMTIIGFVDFVANLLNRLIDGALVSV
jgi:hypothetical protein